MSATAAIFDIEGALVDTNCQHALAWYRAFRRAVFESVAGPEKLLP